jgi:hypothetical protein
VSEKHDCCNRKTLPETEWVAHYKQRRPDASLDPGIPDVPPEKLARPNGHHMIAGHRVIAAPILAGLHHEYRLEPQAA